MIHIWKGLDGYRQMLIISGNAYIDREREIVAEKALNRYVEMSWSGETYIGKNVLLYWHSDKPDTAHENAIGDIVYCTMHSHFLIEVAKERPDKQIDIARKRKDVAVTPYLISIKEVWDAIELSDVEWGASIGFGYLEGNKQNDTYERILKYETSILPVAYAANAITYSEIIKD